MVSILRTIWNYKSFILGLVSRDFKSKYLNSLFGAIWSVINPLAMIVVYTVIFSQIMQAKLPGITDTWAFSIYLCAGVIPWNFFVETIQRMQGLFLEQGNIIKKSNFPRSTLPIYILISCSINFIIVFILFFIFLLINNSVPTFSLLALIPLLLIQQIFAVGLGLILGTLNVFFRDIGHVFGIIIQFWFWFTPIVYPAQIIPQKLSFLFSLNIMTPVIKGYQSVFLYNKLPYWESLIPISIVSVILIIISYYIFKKLEAEMVDEL